jgi:predicted membrane protein
MSDQNYPPGDFNRFREHNPANRVFFGIAVALLGIALLLKSLGILPHFLRFSWPVVLIIVGVMIGVKNNFRKNAWWILILVGVAHLVPSFQIMGHSSRHLFWPAAIIVAGLAIAFRPRRKNCYPKQVINAHITSDSRLYVDVTFGGRKEIITAKDFKGGEVSVSFGGSEINLSQADFAGESIVIDCRVAFGGIELVVPSNWEVQNEIRPTFGSIEDERIIHGSKTGEGKKKLILQGSCTFGGIEIKSF